MIFWLEFCRKSPPRRAAGGKIIKVLHWPAWSNDQRALLYSSEFIWNLVEILKLWLDCLFSVFHKIWEILVIVSLTIIFCSLLPLLAFCDSHYIYVRMFDTALQITESLPLSIIFVHFLVSRTFILPSLSSLTFFHHLNPL